MPFGRRTELGGGRDVRGPPQVRQYEKKKTETRRKANAQNFSRVNDFKF